MTAPDQPAAITVSGDKATAPDQPTRLISEAQRSAHFLTTAAALETAAAIIRAAQWGQPGALWQAATALAAAAISAVMAVRWTRRARWYAETGQWWTRLDEAPPVLPFPRLHAWLHQPIGGKR